MRTDRAVTRPCSEPVSVRLIVDRQTPVKTLPPLAVGKNTSWTVGDPGLPKRRVPDSERFSTGYILANVYRKLHKMGKKGQEKNIFCAPSKSASVKINCIGGFKEGARDVPTSKKSWIRHCTIQDNLPISLRDISNKSNNKPKSTVTSLSTENKTELNDLFSMTDTSS